MGRTRLAPSPTGALHLGNARTFAINWALARQNGWQILLRIDDLDGPRIKSDAAQGAIDDLRWLGLDWDEGPVYQRADLSVYRDALRRLIEAGWAYPCDCTRQQVQAATLSAPHGDQHELRYPGTCRQRCKNLQRDRPLVDDDFLQAWRLIVPDEPVHVIDQFAGDHAFNLHESIGDFLLWTKQGLPSYQLAVVVDDARQGIDHVVRGDDLLSSAARQKVLYERLGLQSLPQYFHLPLIVGSDGRRLAKRHGDSRVAAYRQAGVTPSRLLALIAQWCGLGPRESMTATEFCDEFRLDRLAKDAVVFTAEHDAWLRRSA
jgi:glutamyl-tRNA synthetase